MRFFSKLVHITITFNYLFRDLKLYENLTLLTYTSAKFQVPKQTIIGNFDIDKF